MTKPINAFPGYEYVYNPDEKKYHNMYRGVDVGLGGYVYAEPGMYSNVALLDVASLHPHSIINMNCFGEYTQNFKDILDTRMLIKHREYDKARELFNGRLNKYLDDPEQAKQLAQALKIAINSVYGLTSASFENAFKDPRNKNNIVALRGALFMKTLQDEVVKQGYTVAHIKTDSIKIPNADTKIIDFCMKFAKKYGYTFEHEATYERMCLVNNAVYIAKYQRPEWCEKQYGYIPGDCSDHGGEWTATGTQFQVPYVFKTLFSKEPIEFADLCETKEVKKGALYLDMNESLKEDEHDYHFVGRVGSFSPILPGKGGGLLLRVDGDKYYSATGAKDYRWMESEMVRDLKKEKDIDKSYYGRLVDEAVETISQFGDFNWFVSEQPNTMIYREIKDTIQSDPLPESFNI